MFNRDVFDTLDSIVKKIQKMPLRVSGEVVQLKKPAEMIARGAAASSTSGPTRVNSTPTATMHRRASTNVRPLRHDSAQFPTRFAALCRPRTHAPGDSLPGDLLYFVPMLGGC